MQEYTRDQLSTLAHHVASTLGGHAVITGAWVWVEFPSKPSAANRAELKDLGFKWAPKKNKWYFAGKPRAGRKPMSWEYITGKYGTEEVA
jgi:hypothetical protein